MGLYPALKGPYPEPRGLYPAFRGLNLALRGLLIIVGSPLPAPPQNSYFPDAFVLVLEFYPGESSSSSYLHDRIAVRSGAGTPQVPCQEWCRYPSGALANISSGPEISRLGLRLSVSQGPPLGDFLIAPACPIEKVTLWAGFLHLMRGIRN